ncbi:hypothetical protein GCM10011609_29910 [Lentzea pudingi]|uniref:Uncharacterized protein n=1 Tax=Lentzea pudingi TaxID=1789439 RepID=A0ABQ2HU55_9PSEU|nr:virion tegument protein [Lentzea pudingi]GGM90836.1 hypothetical protein GCM10011609_29910 [Lentzea pudingi]
MNGFGEAWRRINELQGEEFHQKTGRPFTYRVVSGQIVPDTTDRQLPMSHFRRAFDRAPLPGPGSIQDLQGPSYIWAILTDPRVAPQTRG